ncbi:hypothetical protein B0H17DRAFT_1333813 [Mycena rosella]|uniref:Uncharacterized protein n=1 Tax=Mycena rosella TaxID=1033263 RepID=A0AAD7D6D3_MYCRO|nr:hypothetical protein B0H17DRAFT_1333813 [Mycena rosella]
MQMVIAHVGIGDQSRVVLAIRAPSSLVARPLRSSRPDPHPRPRPAPAPLPASPPLVPRPAPPRPPAHEKTPNHSSRKPRPASSLRPGRWAVPSSDAAGYGEEEQRGRSCEAAGRCGALVAAGAAQEDVRRTCPSSASACTLSMDHDERGRACVHVRAHRLRRSSSHDCSPPPPPPPPPCPESSRPCARIASTPCTPALHPIPKLPITSHPPVPLVLPHKRARAVVHVLVLLRPVRSALFARVRMYDPSMPSEAADGR